MAKLIELLTEAEISELSKSSLVGVSLLNKDFKNLTIQEVSAIAGRILFTEGVERPEGVLVAGAIVILTSRAEKLNLPLY